ncbi:MAG TPA: DEAD/DEAH box helicase [Nitrospinaceae bacterium]|nr:DEAD/DEAH box helicase [Nitrospinaceae bacterium]|tara:strand:- start:594 stop:1967 length:1374 start_codon:yes stop_codon:yes gene_type:complete
MLANLEVQSVPAGFETLNLIKPICRAVREEKYDSPTPIQEQAIPHLVQGRDLLGCAQTGTGKTAAFALPVLQWLEKNREIPGPKGARTLILAPTRELAAQIHESFRIYGRYLNIKQAVVYGGVRQGLQVRALSRGVDVLVATPGRLLDLLNQRQLRLDKVGVLVLDEADRMLDMGFLPDIKKVCAAIPSKRQTILFSATLPEEIVKLSKSFLNDPVKVSVNPPSSTVDKIEQKVLFVDREDKSALLESLLTEGGSLERVLVFTRTKHGANRIAKRLTKMKISTEAIHGNKSQPARLQALEKFRAGVARVLVATDIASRGLDVDGITHVINYELPKESESYVHRIGRTARAGALGIAVSLCDAGEKSYLKKIEREINRPLTVDIDHPFHSESIAAKRSGGKPDSGNYFKGRGRGRGKGGANGSAARSGGKTKSSSFSRRGPAGRLANGRKSTGNRGRG